MNKKRLIIFSTLVAALVVISLKAVSFVESTD